MTEQAPMDPYIERTLLNIPLDQRVEIRKARLSKAAEELLQQPDQEQGE